VNDPFGSKLHEAQLTFNRRYDFFSASQRCVWLYIGYLIICSSDFFSLSSDFAN